MDKSAREEFFDESAFSVSGTPAERLMVAVNYAILAPSSHNSQPWHFVVQNNSVLVCADRSRALPVVDPFDRELVISCAAALFNLRVALSHFGQPYRIAVLPYPADADVLAQLFIESAGHRDAALGQLFGALRLRVTNRSDFAAEPVPRPLQEALCRAAEEEGAALACAEDASLRARVAELVAEGDRRQFSDPHFRRELAAWIHGARKDDGMPAYALGLRDLLDMATPLLGTVVRTFDIGSGIAASHRRIAEGSPLLLCLSTSMDNSESWICAGQALQRVLLIAAGEGYAVSYLNQPIEVAALRAELRAAFSAEAFPQLLLRMGKGRPAAPTPRRPLQAVCW